MSINLKQPLAILENYQNSVKNRLVDEFLNMYDHDVIVYDAWNKWHYQGINELKPVIKKWFDEMNTDKANVVVSFEDTIIKEDQTLAFIHTTVIYQRQNEQNQLEKSIKNRFTFCLQKIDDQWKIIHEHSSMPIEYES